MGQSTYLYKNLPQDHIDFIRFLDDEGLDIFTLDHIRRLYTEYNDHNELLENLHRKGILTRVERGVYVRHNFRNEYVIGSFLTDDAVIGYWSALHLHGLTDQIPNTVFIQTTKKKKDKIIFGVHCKFIKVKPGKITGIENAGYGNHTYRMTDIEKTIVDCFDLPEYAGEFPKLISAFYTANLKAGKLKEYCTSVSNISVTKKLGYLAELFEKPGMKSFVQYSKGKVTNTISNFDPYGENTGRIITKWGLRMNIPPETILELRDY